jgi:hypothetical protein
VDKTSATASGAQSPAGTRFSAQRRSTADSGGRGERACSSVSSLSVMAMMSHSEPPPQYSIAICVCRRA